MKAQNKPKIGAHVSVAGGLYKAFENARSIGADCVQIFGASPRQWRTLLPGDAEVAKFKHARAESGIDPVYLHAAYLVNLASPNQEILKKSVQSLIDHLKIASLLGADGLIFHVGSGKGGSKKTALDQEAGAMKEILRIVSGNAKLIMENTAGGGDKIGDIGDIAYLYYQVKSERVKVCYDTAHGFESGMIEKYGVENTKELFDRWDKAVGIKNIIVIHANDSKTACNSHHDRHENIGDGYIGKQGFKALAKEKKLMDKAFILEVPGFGGNGPDKKNVDILKSCFNN